MEHTQPTTPVKIHSAVAEITPALILEVQQHNALLEAFLYRVACDLLKAVRVAAVDSQKPLGALTLTLDAYAKDNSEAPA